MKSSYLIKRLFIFLIVCSSVPGQISQPSSDSSQMIADRIVQSKIPILIDFWAPWCGPCRMLNPIIADLEKNYTGRVLFIKVNVDIHRALSTYFGISSIPSIFIVNNKSVVTTLPGVQPKENYIKALDAILANADKTPPDSNGISTTPPAKGP